MNRSTFFKNLGALVASTLVVPPILEALATDGPITCGKGLIWQIEHGGSISTYENIIVSKAWIEEFDKAMREAHNNYIIEWIETKPI